MNTFTVNNKTYIAKPFDFNLVCDLEDMGISMSDAEKKPMGLIRAYFSICAGRDRDFAGNEMQAHILGGNTFDEIMGAMSKEMDMSDFFRNLNKSEEAEAQTNTKGKKQEKNTEI